MWERERNQEGESGIVVTMVYSRTREAEMGKCRCRRHGRSADDEGDISIEEESTEESDDEESEDEK
jgi:hypothetical protein